MRPLAFISLSVVLTGTVPAFAQTAQTTSSASPRPASSGSPAPNAHAPSPGRLTLVRGQQAYVAHRYDEALAAFREAAGTADQRVEATLDIGYALASRNEREAAITAFREAIAFATTSDDLANRTRGLQAVANTCEAMGNLEQALAAWTEYQTFAEAHPTQATAATARSRIEAIHTRQQNDTRDALVRQRIEERRRHNASAQPQS